MNNDFSLLSVMKVLGKWKKHILITTVAVAILSAIGSLLMPNYYESSTTFYAAHPDLGRPEPVGEGSGISKFVYGTNDDLDRLFSIANSSELRNMIVAKHNLYDHYKIDSTSRKGPAKMAKKFNKLYNTTKTKYDAMTISMEDTDPELARDIVGTAREALSVKAQELVKLAQSKTLESSATAIKAQEEASKEINKELLILKRTFGIYDSESQGEVLAEMITSTASTLDQRIAQLAALKRSPAARRDSISKISALVEGLKQKKASLLAADSLYASGIMEVLTLEQSHIRLSDELSLEKERYKKLQSSYDNSFVALHIVEQEEVPVEKSRPRRSLIVIGLTLLAFLLSCLAVLLIDATKDINWRDIYNG